MRLILTLSYHRTQTGLNSDILLCLFLLAWLMLALMPTSYASANNTRQVAAENQMGEQTFFSCSIITSEHLTALQLYQRGLPLKLAAESLPGITRDGKKRLGHVYELAEKIGILNAYADINTNYARCSTLVFERLGKPAADLKEHGYYFCAGENKVRFEIILKLDRTFSAREIIKDLPAQYESVVRSYQQLIHSQGNLAAFDLTANNLKACLQQIE